MNLDASSSAQESQRSIAALGQRIGFAPQRLFADYATSFFFLAAAAFVFVCNVTPMLGQRMVLAKHHVGVLFCLLALALFSRHLSAANVKRLLLDPRRWLADIAPFLVFWALIGGHCLVSHGKLYASMSLDFWHGDPLSVLIRRITVPGLAHMLGIGAVGYLYYWYAMLFACFCFANRFLQAQGLLWIERISVLTSSVLAYLFMAPGYVEVFVLLCGLYVLSFPTSFWEKIVLAALMFGAHEVAAPLIFLPIILVSCGRERTDWTTIAVSLLVVYAAGYAWNWHGHLHETLHRQMQPSAGEAVTAFDLVRQHPLFAMLAVFIAYKLYWGVVLASLFSADARQRWLALCVIASIPTMFIACDASRLIQFSTLAIFLVVGQRLPRWPTWARTLLAAANMLIPSFYVGTNCAPLWGEYGVYSWYLKFAATLGHNWGRIFD